MGWLGLRSADLIFLGSRPWPSADLFFFGIGQDGPSADFFFLEDGQGGAWGWPRSRKHQELTQTTGFHSISNDFASISGPPSRRMTTSVFIGDDIFLACQAGFWAQSADLIFFGIPALAKCRPIFYFGWLGLRSADFIFCWGSQIKNKWYQIKFVRN